VRELGVFGFKLAPAPAEVVVPAVLAGELAQFPDEPVPVLGG